MSNTPLGGGNPINSLGTSATALYGTDLYGVTGLDPNMGEVSGSLLVVQRCCRRLNMRRGSALDCPNDGLDLCAWLGKDIHLTAAGQSPELARLAQEIAAELEKEECVFEAVVTKIAYSPSTRAVNPLTIQITTALGPFSMTLSVSPSIFQLLAVN